MTPSFIVIFYDGSINGSLLIPYGKPTVVQAPYKHEKEVQISELYLTPWPKLA